MKDKRPPIRPIQYLVEAAAAHAADEKVIRWAHATALQEATAACRREPDMTVLAENVTLERTVVGPAKVVFVFIAQPTWRPRRLRKG